MEFCFFIFILVMNLLYLTSISCPKSLVFKLNLQVLTLIPLGTLNEDGRINIVIGTSSDFKTYQKHPQTT